MKLNIKERISKATDAVLDFNARKAGKMLVYPVTAPVAALKKKREEQEEAARQHLADNMAQAMIIALENTGASFMEQAHEGASAHTKEEIEAMIDVTRKANTPD